MRTVFKFGLLTIIAGLAANAQDDNPAASERWSVYFQSTAIGQVHPGFDALYSGVQSLPDYAEKRVSLTGTIFADFRAGDFVDIVVNPEIAGGRGFGYVSGIAGFTNGEIPRVAGATPTPYIARAYLRAVAPLGGSTQTVEAGPNRLGGTQKSSRLTFVMGKFAISDFFDNNAYSHDPRSQFMNWALMSNGAWDYPADVRGYTAGAVIDLTVGAWSARWATVMEPTYANGPTLDTHLLKNRGMVWEAEHRHAVAKHPGAVRLLGFLNREHAGTYLAAIHAAETSGAIPTLDASRRDGTEKYGFGINFDQELAPDLGVFGRYSWSDGKTEAWAFTQIDRSVSGGVSIGGRYWGRPSHHFGAAFVRDYLSGDQRSFLGLGGLGFIIGDGRLNYTPESIFETYYSVPVRYGFTATGDYQHVNSPAYNRDRGPVSVYSLRIHWEASLRRH
jgi:high affinity Mn2+ porin